MSGKLFHAPFLEAHPGFHLASVVERHQSESQERYPNAKLVRSVAELCADPGLDLIVVNTPTHLHFEHAKMVLEAGKHLVIEKPFTITVRDAEELIAIANKNKLNITIYQNRRYDGDFRAVKEVVDNKLLGELREVEIRYDRYRPSYGGKPHKEGELPGAGILFDLSPHLVDQALQLFGWPKAIFADLWKMRDDVVPPDYFEMLFYYNRLRVRLKATCICRESPGGYQLHGMKGSFLQERSDLQEQQLQLGKVPSISSWCPGPAKPDGLLHTEINGQTVREERTSAPGNYMGFYDDLYQYMEGKRDNPVPAEDGVKTIRIIEATQLSMKEGRVVEL